MYAIVDILGQQFKVAENSKYYVPKLSEEINQEVTFESVLLLNDDKETKIGSPYIKGAKIQAKVLEHLQDDKVLVFKKKRRTGYQKMNGHRQQLTKIEVTSIG